MWSYGYYCSACLCKLYFFAVVSGNYATNVITRRTQTEERNILFTSTVKVKHKLPYHTFIYRVWKSYTKTKIFENMGFDMKHDLTYNHFIEKRSWFGNRYLSYEPYPTLVKSEIIVKNQNGKNGVEIILKNGLKISCSIFREGLRGYIFVKERKPSHVCHRYRIKHTPNITKPVCLIIFHRSSLLSLCQPVDSSQAHSAT